MKIIIIIRIKGDVLLILVISPKYDIVKIYDFNKTHSNKLGEIHESVTLSTFYFCSPSTSI